MDMAVANQLNQTEENPEGTRRTNFQPQDGKFMDVYSGPNQSLVIIGVTAKGQLWKKELYKGFFDIFDNWANSISCCYYLLPIGRKQFRLNT